jgi:hypothetical protein
MMYKRLGRRNELAVVRICPDILDIPGTVIADGNAASVGARFESSPIGPAVLDEQRVYAEYWTDSDMWAYYEKKRQRCAEVLVPDLVPPDFLIGCYVWADGAARTCQQAAPGLEVVVNARVFFS